MSAFHPAFVLFITAWRSHDCAGRRAPGRPSGRDIGSALGDVATWYGRESVVDPAQLHAASAARGHPEPRLRPDFQPDRLHWRSVRLARAARRRARRHPGLRRRGSWRRVRGRLDHAVRLLGTDGGGVTVRGVVRGHAAVAGGRVPLSAGPYSGRLAAVLRHSGPLAARR